jgi:hypothetical protein
MDRVQADYYFEKLCSCKTSALVVFINMKHTVRIIIDPFFCCELEFFHITRRVFCTATACAFKGNQNWGVLENFKKSFLLAVFSFEVRIYWNMHQPVCRSLPVERNCDVAGSKPCCSPLATHHSFIFYSLHMLGIEQRLSRIVRSQIYYNRVQSVCIVHKYLCFTTFRSNVLLGCDNV